MENVDTILNKYVSNRHLFEHFMNGVVDTFRLDPSLNDYHHPVIHTIKSRLKDVDHLRDKIERKNSSDAPISEENVFYRVTDLAGVRILHLYQDQLKNIHELIQKKVDDGDWFYRESPIAYSWDPESCDFFTSLGLTPKIKESYYTSIHYVIKPKTDSNICCEIQVRTLFEEIWGEIDHTINYPHPTENFACKEQLRVLSKLVSTGTRLADSIFRVKGQ
ncbi:(p)ppGpp synthetase [Edwardsiella ictaluri]|uniref:RelA / SpoT domain protein n=1 Tax=Edwardsiella ictaluri (strain 93-146) TaxID=634503 RepID=C5BGZ3_EDWI9|nr:RelA/SpoT domain-containing protein [Edwardsiella ictaluri]ACR69424.1 RelA / SpoT domain protein [Edwardsiella ictaluri 93-146]AVZ83558.1 (p)ppGpp synthetase [Edwardsiella ictaluri]EKS7764149.1 RelA/SpoT domain-containing protein [Edwardsiella ictaluri]EKS7771008.1 RelA/SpoT domain-containing protein [Edwardsiella ictaluri]EKS7774100.1 RelA/SpoT domain-containing protein [Edwardsiella ictaluri]